MSGLAQFFAGASESRTKTFAYEDSLVGGRKAKRAPLHPPTRTDTVTFAQWKEHQLGWLGAFMEERLRHDPNEEETTNDNNNNHTGNTGTQSSEGDTTISTNTTHQDSTPPSPSRTSHQDRQHSHEHMPSIPHHMDETFHRATSLNDLNLRTHQVHLGRLRAHKVWSERLTHRPTVTHVLPRRQEFYTHLPEFIPMSLKPCLEDGPMGPIYHSVISMEVQQAPAQTTITTTTTTTTNVAPSEHDQVKLLAHAAAMASSSTGPSRRYTRLMVFFYNQYAKALSYIVSNYAHAKEYKHCQLHVELIHVPAVSIMPFGSGQTDWFNRQSLSPYCICLGARSNMTVRRDSDGQKVHRRFDGLYQKGVLVPNTEHVLVKVTLVDERGEPHTVVREWEVSCHHKGRPVKYVLDVTQQKRDQEAAAKAKHTVTRRRKRSQVAHDDGAAPPAGTAKAYSNNTSKRARATTARKAPQEPRASTQQAPCIEPLQVANTQQTRPLRPLTPPRPSKTRLTGAKIRDLLGEQGVPISEDDGTKYHTLGELQEYYEQFPDKQCFVNVYAVVIGIKSASITKKGDHMVSLTLVDQSLDEGLSSEHDFRAVQINIFEKEKDRLPDVQICGDVIRIHRAKIQIYKDTLQLLGLQGTSYMCFRQGSQDDRDQENSGLSVILSPSKKCSYRKSDEIHLPRMWLWGQERIASRPTIHQEHASTLSAANPMQNSRDPQNNEGLGEERDLTLMVTAIIDQVEGTGDTDPVGYLRVWDGTPGPSDPYPTPESAAKLPLLGDPPCVAIDRLCSVIERLKSSDKSSDLTLPDSVTGRVANVAIWEASMWSLVKKVLQPGMFLRLRNVKEGNFCHVPCLNAYKSTHLTPLPDMTYEVLQLIQEHDRRLKRGEPTNKESGVRSLHVEETLGQIDPDQTTSEFPHFTSSRLPSLFRGPLKIVDTHPSLSETAPSNVLRAFQERKLLRVTLTQARHHEGEQRLLDAMVTWSSPAGKQLVDALSIQLPLRDSLWQASILGVVKERAKYFVLDTLDPCS